jgi:hypothetical protein
MVQRGDGTMDSTCPNDNAPAKWPLYVRLLAVFYVLSYAVQIVAFLGLMGTAVVLFSLRQQVDEWVLGLGLGGLVCVILCEVFRRWFVRWGRRNYPTGKPMP